MILCSLELALATRNAEAPKLECSPCNCQMTCPDYSKFFEQMQAKRCEPPVVAAASPPATTRVSSPEIWQWEVIGSELQVNAPANAAIVSWFESQDKIEGELILRRGQVLRSANGQYHAVLQHNGYLVVYLSSHFVDANRLYALPNVVESLSLSYRGLKFGKNHAWEMSWKDQPAKRLVMQDDGNLVLYNTKYEAVWSTLTDPVRRERRRTSANAKVPGHTYLSPGEHSQ
jgi:hypothetical protein